jgi:hypothetical protein
VLEEIHAAHEECERLVKLIQGKPVMRLFRYRAVFGDPVDFEKIAATRATAIGEAAGGAGGPTRKPLVAIQETVEELATKDYLKEYAMP